MKNFIINNKKGIIIIVILLILCIIFKILLSSKHSNSSNILISSYVSNLERNDVDLDNSICDLDNVLKYNNIPYFKLNNNTYQEINKEILTNFLLRTCYQDGFIDYEVSLNDDILSLALNISYDTDDDLAYLEYKTYNINIKTNEKVSNEEILKKYNISKLAIEEIVLDKIEEYYNYEKKMNYLNNESFNDYLEILEFSPITLDNMNLYIDKNNDLYLYKDYTLSEGMSIDEDFPYITIKFKLT
ncbi:MAG: hypothetical protein IKN63_04845 [Bacilli bacterium]|nr:hypothetical protein [Bacilli bacterium]